MRNRIQIACVGLILLAAAATAQAKVPETLVWTDHSGAAAPVGKVQSSDLGGNNVDDLFVGTGTQPMGVAIDIFDEKVFWTDFVTDKITRTDLDGGNLVEIITTGLSIPTGIVCDYVNQHIYWGDLGLGAAAPTIKRADYDGGNVMTILDGLDGLIGPRGVALDIAANKIYWSDQPAATFVSDVKRANLDGSNPEVIFHIENGVVEGLDLDLVDGRVYMADWKNNAIRVMNLDGGSPDTFVFANDPQDVAVDPIARTLYWTERDPGATDTVPETAGRIRRIGLDGSGLTTVVSGLDDPYGVAVPEPATMVLLALGSLGLLAARKRR